MKQPQAATKARVWEALAAAKSKVADPRELIGQSFHPWVREWAAANNLPVRETRFAPAGSLFIVGAVEVEGMLFP